MYRWEPPKTLFFHPWFKKSYFLNLHYSSHMQHQMGLSIIVFFRKIGHFHRDCFKRISIILLNAQFLQQQRNKLQNDKSLIFYKSLEKSFWKMRLSWKYSGESQRDREGTNGRREVMNKVGNETEKKAAFANTRITNQQYLERVIIIVIPYFWTHNSFLYYSTQKLFSFLFFLSLFQFSAKCSSSLFLSATKYCERKNSERHTHKNAKFRVGWMRIETALVGFAGSTGTCTCMFEAWS